MVEPLPEGYEDRLALELLNQEPPLDLEILEDLMGRRKRHGELRTVLPGRSDYVLTKGSDACRITGPYKADSPTTFGGRRTA